MLKQNERKKKDYESAAQTFQFKIACTVEMIKSGSSGWCIDEIFLSFSSVWFFN